MIEIYAQLNEFHDLKPASKEYADMLKAYKPNQMLRIQIWGTKKQRSVLQHRWAMWMIRFVSESDDDPDWNTFERAKRQIKMIMKFFKDDVVVHGNKVYFELRSFSFTEMPQMEATRIYNDIKLICAERLKVDPQKLEAQAQNE